MEAAKKELHFWHKAVYDEMAQKPWASVWLPVKGSDGTAEVHTRPASRPGTAVEKVLIHEVLLWAEMHHA